MIFINAILEIGLEITCIYVSYYNTNTPLMSCIGFINVIFVGYQI